MLLAAGTLSQKRPDKCQELLVEVQLGVCSRDEALEKAQAANMDLVRACFFPLKIFPT